MSRQYNPQSEKRFKESLGALFADLEEIPTKTKSMVFLKSSTDTGVIRNGGRNGARYAPQSLLSAFKKLTQSDSSSFYQFHEVEVSSWEQEEANFKRSQILEAEKILIELKKYVGADICHLGGGHDHIYPLLLAASSLYSKLVVVNIDAHADTRTDQEFHSGTPFRQAADLPIDFHLFQIGLHPYANSASTLSHFKKNPMEVLWRNDLNDQSKLDQFFAKIAALTDPHTLLLFSLDADALTAAEMPAVSAVNHHGIGRSELLMLWQRFEKSAGNTARHMGIYELNPVYDTTSQASMRMMSSFIYEIL